MRRPGSGCAPSYLAGPVCCRPLPGLAGYCRPLPRPLLGWLIGPNKKQVHIYRLGQPVQMLDNPSAVSGDPELPGFVLDLEPVWSA